MIVFVISVLVVYKICCISNMFNQFLWEHGVYSVRNRFQKVRLVVNQDNVNISYLWNKNA